MKLKTLIRKVRHRLSTEASGLWDRILYMLRIPVRTALPPGEGPLLLYVGERYQHHVPRIAKWVVRGSDWRTMLICHRHYFPKKYDSSVYHSKATFRNPWHFRRLLLHLRDHVDLAHAFGPYSLYPGILRRETDIPLIDDLKDINVSYFGLEPPFAYFRKDLPHERYLMENAQGIIASSFEAPAAYREYGIAQRPPGIFFPIYCDNDLFTERQKPFDPEDIHIVYVGGVVGSHRDPRVYGTIQFHPVIEQLSTQRIHFHIYPAPSTLPEDYEEYRDMARTNPFLHLHDPVPQAQLADEIAKYDFGWLAFYLEDTSRRFNKLGRGTSVKLFNYLESGVPLIMSPDLAFQAFMARRYEGALIIDKPEIARLGELIREMDYPEMERRLKARREVLSVKAQVGRLLQFYNRFARRKAQLMEGGNG